MITSKSLPTHALVGKEYLIRLYGEGKKQTNETPHLGLVCLGDRGQTCFLWSVVPCCFEEVIPVGLLKPLRAASTGVLCGIGD